MRRFYFPLRSSVELFPDPTSVEAGTRAKEAAVLYDQVLFEDGLLMASVGEDGSIEMWRPPHELTPDEIAAGRKLAEPGQNFTLAVGTESEPGVPASPGGHADHSQHPPTAVLCGRVAFVGDR